MDLKNKYQRDKKHRTEPYEIGYEYEFETDHSVPCRIKKGWHSEGKTGQYFGYIWAGNRKWAIVIWDGDYADQQGPSFFKAEGLEIAKTKWINVKDL